jgi:hypothetical protein
MRLFIALCVLVACGKKVEKDAAVDQYINHDFQTAHAKILAAREAYAQIRADDIDQAGKREYLTFQLRDVATLFLTQALTEAKALKPPPAAAAFHDYTVSVLGDETAIIGDMATAAAAPDVERFKAAHARMMDLQDRVFQWEELRSRMLFAGGVKLAPLPKLRIPEKVPEAPK